MVNLSGISKNIDEIKDKVKKIKLVLTDNDGVLTDTGVYYSENGEELKRYSVRDGMGVERLRKLADIETGIISGENSPSLIKRAGKLNILELHLGIKDKKEAFLIIAKNKILKPENIAYIGDDYNDLEVLKLAGLTASPQDGMPAVKNIVDFICHSYGGHGAFRDFAELILTLRR